MFALMSMLRYCPMDGNRLFRSSTTEGRKIRGIASALVACVESWAEIRRVADALCNCRLGVTSEFV